MSSDTTWLWDFGKQYIQLDHPMTSITGAWVVSIDFQADGSTMRVRECPIDVEFAVPCLKIIGTITFGKDGLFHADGTAVPYYYADF